MKLIRLTLKNFMPFKEETILEFPQDSDRNTVVVLGDNMRGKTSLLNGVRWAFYGKAQGRHLRPIPIELMPNREAAAQGDWTMEARIQFTSGGSEYDLRRELKKRSKITVPERAEDFQCFTFLKKDGAAIPASEIESEINAFAPEQVSRFFLFDGELLQEYEELLVEGSEQGKAIKEAIEQALGVPALTRGRDDFQVLLKRAQKEQGKEASTVKGLEIVAEQFAKWSERRDALETDLTALKLQHSKVKEEKLSLEDAIAASQSVYVQKIELDSKVSRLMDLKKEIKTKEDIKRSLASEAWRDLLRPRILAKKHELQTLLDRAMFEFKERTKLQFQIEHLRKHLANKTCPTCGQDIDNSLRESQRNELEACVAAERKIAVSGIDVDEITRNLKALDLVLGQPVKDRLLDTNRDLAGLEVEYSRIENRIDELNQELDGQNAEESIRLRQLHSQALRDETKAALEIEDRHKRIAEADREIQILTQRMNAQAGKNTTKAAQIATLMAKMHDIFSTSIDRLRSNLRVTVERNATTAFLAMSTQKAYTGLSINANYGLTIIDKHGNGVPLRSAGAEQIVALSLIDGLSHSGRSAGPVVMDTPFGRLDTKHRQNILAYLPSSASQLVLLVHDGEIGGGAVLEALAHRIGGMYEIKEVTPNHSTLQKLS